MTRRLGPAGSVVLGGSLLGRLAAPLTDPSLDTRVRQARLGAILCGMGAAVGAATIPFMPAWVDEGWIWATAAGAAGMAVLLLVLPWHRWPQRAILIPTFLGGLHRGGRGRLRPRPALLPAAVRPDVRLRRRDAASRVPRSPWRRSALAFGSAQRSLTGSHGFVFVPLVIMVGVSTMLGELIADYVRMQRVAGDTLDELLMGVAGLTGCRDRG